MSRWYIHEQREHYPSFLFCNSHLYQKFASLLKHIFFICSSKTINRDFEKKTSFPDHQKTSICVQIKFLNNKTIALLSLRFCYQAHHFVLIILRHKNLHGGMPDFAHTPHDLWNLRPSALASIQYPVKCSFVTQRPLKNAWHS